MTKQVTIGSVTIGGNSPIAVQSMLNRPYSDIDGNIEQSVQLQAAGCDINRVAIPNQQAIQLIPLIKNVTTMPLVADIHFDHMLAIKSIEAGIDKIRYNPGNIGSLDKAKQVIDAAKANNVPIRVGVNSGSLDKTLLKKYGGVTGQGIYESAIGHVKLIENAGYDRIVISIKASGLKTMTEAYRIAAASIDYPLHLGVTEAGTVETGSIKSAIGIGSLLLDGIGDTIRVSLTGDPVSEVSVAKNILRVLGMTDEVTVISCPTCGRTSIDIISIASSVEAKTKHIRKKLKVAVMGCEVNGPGEAADADIGIAAGKNSAVLFKQGKPVRKITENYVEELVREIELWKSE